jgi:hypothetical protein
MFAGSPPKLSCVCYDADVWYSARITNLFLSNLTFMWAENISLKISSLYLEVFGRHYTF